MALKVGDRIWLPCEVRPGPFENERLVRVTSEDGGEQILSFVQVSELKEQISSGNTFVKAIVVEVSPTNFYARLPGHAVNPAPFHGLVERVGAV